MSLSPLPINRDTQVCISLAIKPGNFGNRFHNYLFKALKLNYIYKSFGTQDLVGAMRGVRALGIRGCSVTMPYKMEAIRFLDSLDRQSRRIGAVNTIVNDGRKLKGFNTDTEAVRKLLAVRGWPNSFNVLLMGSGGMARAVAQALSALGFHHVVVLARNKTQGYRLARKYGYRWARTIPSGEKFEILINATPLGSPAMPGLPFGSGMIHAARGVIDVVIHGRGTTLAMKARHEGKDVISGTELAIAQARAQFTLYTGKEPSERQVRQAAQFAARGL